MAKNHTTEKIISFLRVNKKGATPTDIAKITKINRMTVSKYLNILKAINLVDYKDIGMKKVYFLVDSPVFKGIDTWDESNHAKNMVDDFGFGVAIIDKDMNVKWFNKNMENWIGKKPGDVKGSCCYGVFKNNKAVCENCPTEKTLRDGKVHKAVQDGIDKDGNRIFFYLMTSPLYDNERRVIGVVEMVMELNNCEEIIRQAKALKEKFN